MNRLLNAIISLANEFGESTSSGSINFDVYAVVVFLCCC